jgi:hypothetical protein
MKKIISYFTIILTLCCTGCGSGDEENNIDDEPQFLIPLPVNLAPVSDDLSIVINADTITDITLSAHDTDEDVLIYHIEKKPDNGTVVLNDTIVTYTPNVNFIGQDKFTYKANDGAEDSNISTVNIKVNQQHASELQALDQTRTLELSNNLAIRLTSNAHFNTPVSFEIVDEPKYGKLHGTLPNLKYVLNDLTYTGNDELTFRVNNGGTWSEKATVSIFVRENHVISAHAGGSDQGIYLHVPNHLAYQEVGPNQFRLNVDKNDEDLLDKNISRIQANQKLLTVDLTDKSLSPPYTIALKWIPDELGQTDTLLQSSAINIHETAGKLTTEYSTGNFLYHDGLITDSACNQTTILVEDKKITTYVNGVKNQVTVPESDPLTGQLKFGNYKGKIWDLRVYNHTLSDDEVDSIATDCSGTRTVPFKIDGKYIDFKSAELYQCGVYMCLWYADDEFTDLEVANYLKFQDYSYEHNLFNIGMYPYGNIGDYFSLGLPGWDSVSKERDVLLDDFFGIHAKFENPADAGYYVHEDFHFYQGPVDDYTGRKFSSFLAESTAEWSIIEYSPESQQSHILSEYIFDPHLPMWMISTDNQTSYSTIRNDGINQGGHPYGASVFITYLSREILNYKIVGDAYNVTENGDRPVKALYDLLSDAGVDMRDMFIEFAARTITYDYKSGLTEAFRTNEQKSLSWIQETINPEITQDSKFVSVFDEQGTGSSWQSPEPGKRPGSWAYNLYKVEQAQGNYHIAVAPDSNNPSHAEFRAMAVLYDKETETRSYFSLPTDNLTQGIEVKAQGEDLYLVVATTPSSRFIGNEQYDYQYKIDQVTSKSMYLMAGQSNMEGNVDLALLDGMLDDLSLSDSVEAETKLVDRLRNWYQTYDEGYAQYAASDTVNKFEAQEMIRLYQLGLVSDKLTQPLDNILCSINNTAILPLQTNCGFAFGPELGLGHYLTLNDYKSASLIKIVEGGTDLHTDWLSPSAVKGNKQVGTYFNVLSDKISSLNTQPASIHPDCLIMTCQWDAFVWFQGEADSFSASGAKDYEHNLRHFITDVRNRIGRTDLPIVLVEIGHWAKGLDYGQQVAAAQQKIASADPNIRIVKTDDLSRYFHYDPAAQLIIGERIGLALTELSVNK